MSVNRYIGLRYVPKLEGVWSNTKSYENLSIVTYNNKSYTSKKLVGVGVDILDSDYWVETGNYNSQIATEMTDIKDMFNNTLSELNSLRSQFNNLESETWRKVYPKGSLYLSFDSINPSSKFGGVWELVSKGKYLFGCSDVNDVGLNGGRGLFTLTKDNLPNVKLDVESFSLPQHSHNINHTHEFNTTELTKDFVDNGLSTNFKQLEFVKGGTVDSESENYIAQVVSDIESNIEVNFNGVTGSGGSATVTNATTENLGSGVSVSLNPSFTQIAVWLRVDVDDSSNVYGSSVNTVTDNPNFIGNTNFNNTYTVTQV